jgi:hypothetical protein
VPKDHFLRPWAPETPPEACLDSLLHKLPAGQRFSRRLTPAERLALTLADAKPERHLTLTSASLDRHELAAAWSRFRKRIARERRMPYNVVYVGVPAKSTGAAGYHLHLLLWTDYLHFATLKGHARETGFGTNLRISEIGRSPRDKLRSTRYVLGQSEPIFGSRHHLGNAARPKGKRPYLRPHDATLATAAPEVLSAFKRAQSQLLSDDELAQTCPLFSKRYSQPDVAVYRSSDGRLSVHG